MGNLGQAEALPQAAHGHGHSLSLTVPPLSVMVFKPVAENRASS